MGVSGVGAVFGGGEDVGVGVGGEGDGWERPFFGSGGVIGEEPAGEGLGGGLAVEDFDKVRVVAVVVFDSIMNWCET